MEKFEPKLYPDTESSGGSQSLNEKTVDPKVSSESAEIELTPEIVKEIMKKVQDIDEEGTAYHSLHAGPIGSPVKDSEEEKLTSVLTSGILGVSSRGIKISHEERKTKSAKEIYLDFIKKQHTRPNVFFNIVGRLTTNISSYPTMRDNFMMFREKGERIAIIFDLSSFVEVVDNDGKELSRQQYSNWTHAQTGSKELNESSDPDYGFRLSSRVPPRLFKGIVIDLRRGILSNGLLNQELQIKLKIILDDMFEAYKENPENLLPVYDIDGNVLWPELKMHEQIIKEMKERNNSSTDHDSE